MIDTSRLKIIDMIKLISADIPIRRVAQTNGGEWAGPCPRCGGDDRFRVWPDPDRGKPRFWCRQCHIKGDAVDYVRLQDPNLSFREAYAVVWGRAPTPAQKVARVRRPVEDKQPAFLSHEYQTRARALMWEFQDVLWSDAGQRARAWLKGRGLTEKTVKDAVLGFNSVDRWEPAKDWGLERDRGVFIARGIVIPWLDNGLVRRLNVRRAKGEPKYLSVAGFSNWLYGALTRLGGFGFGAFVLVEGEIDAISLAQEVSLDRIAPLATGSTTGGRVPELIEQLKAADQVFLAFDADQAGDNAADWWAAVLPNSQRLKPTRHDVNDMLKHGDDLRAWLGLHDADGADHEHAREESALIGEQLALLDVERQSMGWWEHAS